MAYDFKNWQRRVGERMDLSTQLVHLTRKTDAHNAVEVLCHILEQCRIRGSDPRSGFIHGSIPAVCFQDAPLYGISQNVFFEEKYRQEVPSAKIRYQACGLMFLKPYVFAKGGRPVVYDRPSDAKTYLPKDQWWRLVNYDLSDLHSIVDWTHEREWRVPGDFDFEVEKATVILPSHRAYRSFIKTISKEMPDLLGQIKGIVLASSILF